MSAALVADRLDLDALAAALRARPAIAQWQITQVEAVRHERYLTFLAPVCEREARSTRWDIWIALPAADGQQGEATFTLGLGDGAQALSARLDEALVAAAASLNPAFTVCAPGDPGVAAAPSDPDILADRALLADTPGALDQAIAAVTAASATAPWARTCQLELFATVATRRLLTSRELDLSERSTRAYAELVLLHRPDAGDEVEQFDRAEASSFAALDLGGRVERAAVRVRDAARARATPIGTMPVIISEDYLAELLAWYAAHADAGAHARQINALAPGQKVLARRGGDVLDVASDPLVPSLGAYLFDGEGFAPQRQQIVRDDALVGLCGSARWMRYLGKIPAGGCGTLVVPAGSLDRRTLLAGALEVVRFSDFAPRRDTGAFSGEIRLAYLHGPGGPVAVRGGSVTGVLAEAMADVRFSAQTATCGAYHGPVAARFAALTVAG